MKEDFHGKYPSTPQYAMEENHTAPPSAAPANSRRRSSSGAISLCAAMHLHECALAAPAPARIALATLWHSEYRPGAALATLAPFA
jgi:hypothetical protein